MSAGCKEKGYEVSVLDLVAISLYPTQLWARPKAPYPEETGVKAAQVPVNPAGVEEYHSCTSFTATGKATRDGKTVVAVTKMVPIETMQCFILVAFPDKGPSFVSCPQAKELNKSAPYLTYLIAQSIEKMLDEAMLEYEYGMDRAAFASLAGVEGATINEQMTLWGKALTHCAKTQLYAQMVTTKLKTLASACRLDK